MVDKLSLTFVENLPDMNEYTFEMVPGLVGRIAEQLESIDLPNPVHRI